MNELVKINSETNNATTTSLVVAEAFGKRHDHVLRDIDDLKCSKEFYLLNFGEISYRDAMNREQRAYEMTKNGFSILVMGYNGDRAFQFKEAFISEFDKRELMLNSDDYIMDRAMRISVNRTKMLESQLSDSNKRLELQAAVIQEQTPKVRYHDMILRSESSITTTLIAKEIGMTAMALNRNLKERGIIYVTNRASKNKCYVLTAPYQNYGFTETRTAYYTDDSGRGQTAINLVWTEKGRKFIHRVFRSEVSPLKIAKLMVETQ
jgi:Rha family phage regulatory protein